jgi:hypothetical protein
MNKQFLKWLKKQEYTLTDSGLFTYVWGEVMYHTDQNNKQEIIYRREHTWGLWRTKDE